MGGVASGASGPLQFGHGCDAVESLIKDIATGKNLVLQFGHGCDAVERAEALAERKLKGGFNSATVVTPWKDGPEGDARRAAPRFNSATVVTPWKARPGKRKAWK